MGETELPPSDLEAQSKKSPEETLSKESEGLVDTSLEGKNFAVVFSALILCMFLAALDQTIISTALPSIASDLHATSSQYSWVGTSFMLMTTTLTPCYGRLSDMLGRKIILEMSVLIFMIASALCGAAQSMQWLIATRALQGIGAGGIMSMCTVIISDIVPMSERGKYQGFLGGVWGIASVLGHVLPILGGLITDQSTWRWCFFINLPTCGLALVVLYFFLDIKTRKMATWPEFKKVFDFIGLGLLMVSLGCIVVGFEQATDHGFGSPASIALIVVGAAMFGVTIGHFLTTKRKAIIPPRLFKNPTTVLLLLMSYLQAFSFLSSTFYLPIFFQGIKGTSATMSGVHLLSFSLTVSAVSLPTGWLISRYGHIRSFIRVGYAIACLGFGLMNLMNESSSTAVNEIFPLLVGVGIGMSLQPPLILLQAAMPVSDMAATSSSFLLTRTLGATTGISISGAVLSTSLARRLDRIDGYTFTGTPTTSDDYHALQLVQPASVRQEVLHGFSESLSMLFKIYCPFLGACLLMSFFIQRYSLKEAYVPKSERPPAQSPASVAESSAAPIRMHISPVTTTSAATATIDETIWSELSRRPSETTLKSSQDEFQRKGTEKDGKLREEPRSIE
ncbi:Predicted transporter (major facilitator superfamily) [Phaffia rhodozyma]|uniref:Predicted transporter (Major facilitator superfamily) n=1 Tax=Phaffia rhodozyma TaxID=264483 RepID=A0A0F7SSD2_PHARH|nr:Predicted transporter (major facilitator superfamily) [Phaffia rhodozyma]